MDIELVIKIPEEIYKVYKGRPPMLGDAGMDMIAQSIANGTPLPKGHGRLIDADELYDDFIDGTEGYDCQTWNRIEIGDIIEDTPTIIEADKESENKE